MEYARAYGSLHGYCVTLSEGDGFLSLVLTAYFADKNGAETLGEYLQTQALDKSFEVTAVDIRKDRIRVLFPCKGNRIKLLRCFLDWFIPVLEEYGVCKDHICPCCGKVLGQGNWKLVKGVAYCVHEDCARDLQASVEKNKAPVQQKGSYFRGALGATLGAAVGAVTWAVILLLGYMASIVGFLTGLLVDRGYSLLGGKEGKKRIWILCIAVVLGVLMGNILGDCLLVVRDLRIHGRDISFLYSLNLLFSTLGKDSSSLRVFVMNVFLGLMFALVGAISLALREDSKERIPDYADLSYPMIKFGRS